MTSTRSDNAPPGIGTRALLLGSPGRFPFNGHFRCGVRSGRAGLSVAGCVAVGAPPPEAWALSRRIRILLGAVEGKTRFDLLRAAWEALASLEASVLGPEAGDDLGLLLVATDPGGVGVAGTGLASVLARWEDGFEALVPSRHPLLELRGVPRAPPGLFTPARAPRLVLGAPATGALALPEDEDWRLVAGDRDA